MIRREVNGGPLAKLDKLHRDINYHHDIINFSVETHEKIRAEFKLLYEQGLSLGAIAKRTGYSKSKVRVHLLAAGVAIRNFSRGQRRSNQKLDVMYSGGTPYGYAFLEGQLVKDPREYNIVLDIHKMWRSGMSLRAIARHLNGLNVPTRFGKSWKHEVIKKIIERLEMRSS